MDYLNLPRSLIYKDRTDLKDFGVNVLGTMNCLLFSNLKELYKATDRKKELILRCFNNAYYICTIIPFEDFPETQVAEYEKLLLKGDPYDCEEVCAVSMAMVNKLLPACDAKWEPANNDLIETIRYRFTHYQWMNSGARSSFEFMEGKHNTDELVLSPNEFAPRDIIEVIENFSVRDLQVYAEYICERLALLKDSRQRMAGADMAIARIKDYQREFCEDYEYNPKKDSFKYADNDYFVRDLTLEEKVRGCYQQSKEAIDYYKKHYPAMEEDDSKEQEDSTVSNSDNAALEAENEQLRQRLKQCLSQIKELDKEKTELKKKLAEFTEPVVELTAEQKVRMAFALQLLKAAGLTDEMLDDNKSKVATIIHLLTNIGANNNGTYSPTQICQNWLVDKQYYPKRNVEIIKEIDTLCAQLKLSTKSFLKLAE